MYGKVWIGMLDAEGSTLAVAAKSVACVDFNPPRVREIRGLLRARQGLHHPNIARLVGICLEPENEMLWQITEYAEYGAVAPSLEDYTCCCSLEAGLARGMMEEDVCCVLQPANISILPLG
jgi:hypothetical protein